ncbi:class I tRNA ligase family protein [Cellulomonas sp. Sa3CUA2]|uniref:Methionyl-tRNA synthetase n=1 Tax=Cellulomonas avistercoris TaxID=2762242 RepID=A0ABR8QED8_9CELL|nr:class I tRNA ligase family protein [Cellulomonas avistercoris]MBD7918780.1 class I tRNA ligase family protein [Cellulomonas avistercoris]
MTTWLTCTPPTPNGPLHVGHMSGPYIAADVLRRALAAQGEDVRLTTGMDDNQSYVPRRAWADGSDPVDVADRYTRSITTTWRDAGVDFDTVVLPRGEDYDARVRSMFRALVDVGAVVPRATQLPYCEDCSRWLYEAYLGGACPHCGSGTNGNACEQCCRPNACHDVVDPSCIRCGSLATIRPVTLLVLPLEPMRDDLTKYWDSVDMPPRLRAVCDAMAADGLPELLVAHPSDWGVSVPVEGYESHRIYVWLEMAEGYAVERPTATDGHVVGRPVQFFGIDNGYFHAVLFPAVNLALGRHELLAERFVVNEFFLLNGQKFSTSRQHAVWAEELLPVAGRDLLRLHCMLRRPATRQTDFTLQDLARTEAVVDSWQRTFAQTVRLVGATPEPAAADPAPADVRRHARHAARAVDDVRVALTLDGFDPAAAAAGLVELGERVARLADEVAATAPGTPARAPSVAVLRETAEQFADVAAPVVPDGAARLLAALRSGEVPRTKLFGLGA